MYIKNKLEIKIEMKNNFLILGVLFLILSSSNLLAQEDTERYLKTYSKVDLSFSGIGLSIETPISDRILFEAAGGVGAGYMVNEDFKYRWYFDNPSFYASAHAKYYIRKDMRVAKGTSQRFNSGNFFALKAKYTTPTLHDNKTWHTLLAAVHWGLQRNIGEHFLFQLTLGVGGAIDLDNKTTTHVTLYPDANLRFSYILPF